MQFFVFFFAIGVGRDEVRLKRRGSAIASSRLARFCSLTPPAAWVEARTLPAVRPHSPTGAPFRESPLPNTDFLCANPRLLTRFAVRRGTPHLQKLPKEQARVLGLRPHLQAATRPRSNTTCTERCSARHLHSRNRCSSGRSGRILSRSSRLRTCRTKLRTCARPQHQPTCAWPRSILRTQCRY